MVGNLRFLEGSSKRLQLKVWRLSAAEEGSVVPLLRKSGGLRARHHGRIGQLQKTTHCRPEKERQLSQYKIYLWISLALAYDFLAPRVNPTLRRRK